MGAAGEVIGRSLVSSSPPSELHVLAVDDSLVDRKVIEKLLKTFSCKVTAVDSGRRALQFLGLLDGDHNKLGYDHVTQALKPVVNLIMTDYSMPEMTGYDLLKKIKGSSACRDIPVVIMSSETILARIDRCLEEGAEEFLEKPVKLSDIERLTRILLSRDPEDEDEVEVEGEVEVEVEDDNSTRKRTVVQTDDDETASNNNKRLKIIHKKCC